MSDKSLLDIQIEATSEGSGAPIPEAGLLGRVVEKTGFVFAAGIAASAAILLLEVFLRYVFNSPTTWAHETAVALTGVAFLYGGLFCASRDSHVRVVIIYDMLPPRARQVCDVLISAVSCIATIFFIYAAWFMVQSAVWAPDGSIRLQRSGSAWNPPIPAIMKIFLLVILVLIAVQFLVLSINHMKRLRAGSR